MSRPGGGTYLMQPYDNAATIGRLEGCRRGSEQGKPLTCQKLPVEAR